MLSKDTPVIILCGGKGTRIADVTTSIPKPMVPIGGKPILWHIMKIYSHYGYKNFILSLGHKGWAIKEYFLNFVNITADIKIDFKDKGKEITVLSDHEAIDWSITFVETGEETQTGKRIALCKKYIQTPHLMATYGDGVANINIDALVEAHLKMNKMATVTSVKPTSRFGNISVNSEGMVQEFNEKQDAGGGSINGGFFIFKKEFLDIAEECGDVMLERQPMDKLVTMNQLAAYTHNGFWEPMDTMREYMMLNDLWNSGKAKWKTW
jgi:glucose-1-phosphate cytidylyltransferase